MNSFTIISCLILYGLTFLCFFLPFKCGQKNTGKVVGLILGILITLILIGNLDFLVIFIYPVIIFFQLIFIIYWVLRLFNKKKAGIIVTVVLTIGAILLIMSPWISDWTFNKKDVRKILAFHDIELKDNFKIIENESGGFRDFYETFTIKLSDRDYFQLAEKFRTSKHYKGFFTDYKNTPSAGYNSYDTVDFETENFINSEYFTKKKMNNGTYHFRFQLDKKDKELSYIGSDE